MVFCPNPSMRRTYPWFIYGLQTIIQSINYRVKIVYFTRMIVFFQQRSCVFSQDRLLYHQINHGSQPIWWQSIQSWLKVNDHSSEIYDLWAVARKRADSNLTHSNPTESGHLTIHFHSSFILNLLDRTFNCADQVQWSCL